MIKDMNETELLEFTKGRGIDFFLEDDMFELEGVVKEQNGEMIIDVLDAVKHIIEMSGKSLKVSKKNRRLFSERVDKSRKFEMEINRIYKPLIDPQPLDFIELNEKSVLEFFQKPTDTLVWYEKDTAEWFIELNKINMYFSGERKSYPSLVELFEENKEQMPGKWQAVYYKSECEETDFTDI